MVAAVVFWPWFAGLAFLAGGLVIARKEIAAACGLDRLVVLGPTLFAASLAAFGAEHLTAAKGIAGGVPKWIPWHLFWAYFVGLALLAAALSLVARRHMALTASLLGTMFLIFVGTIHIPNVVADPKNRILWAVMLRDTSFAAGALALTGSAMRENWLSASKWLVFAGCMLFGVPIVFFGVEHFLHPEFAPGVPLAKLTPAWVPWRFFGADVIGAVLLVAGISVLVNKWSRLAASTVGLAMVILTLGLYVPIALMAHGPGAQIVGLNYVFDTLLFGGTALLVAGAMPAVERTNWGRWSSQLE